MKWLNKWFIKKVKQAWEEGHTVEISTASPSMLVGGSIGQRDFNAGGITISVYRASGGYVVEPRTYDRKNDRIDSNLYIITDDKNLGEEIGKIITIQTLRS